MISIVFFSLQSLQAQTTTKAVPVLELSGNAYERGLQHGKALKQDIAAVYAKWKDNIRKETKGDPDSVLDAFRKAIHFEPITRKYAPALLDEMKGLAVGSGQEYKDVYAFQLVDEYWVYRNRENNAEKHHCSGIGVPATAGRPAFIAQNMDLENYMQGYQVLLHISATVTEPEQYILSCAGLLALGGMNGKGIGLCMNTLMELESSTDGLPVAFIVRAVLAKQEGKEALQFLKTIKHASGQNYILGIADSVFDFEASANQVVRFQPATSQAVYHTNHALVNHDVKPWYKNYHEEVISGVSKPRDSEIRFASLERRLNKPAAGITEDQIKQTLRSKDNAKSPVCRAYSENGFGFTFSSILYTLGGKRSVSLTNGSPDQSEYKTFYFSQQP
jgi:predicted choloylglycine hydrolase